MGQKNVVFEKQSGEVAENKGKGYINSQKQTGKQSGEVVENTFLWKKRTENEPKTNRAMLLKIHESQNSAFHKRFGVSKASELASMSAASTAGFAVRIC